MVSKGIGEYAVDQCAARGVSPITDSMCASSKASMPMWRGRNSVAFSNADRGSAEVIAGDCYGYIARAERARAGAVLVLEMGVVAAMRCGSVAQAPAVPASRRAEEPNRFGLDRVCASSYQKEDLAYVSCAARWCAAWRSAAL